jgi:glutamyl-tRNA reductase
MGLLTLGINHTCAPIALRERIAFAPEQMTTALNDLVDRNDLTEAVILSTCNRTEIMAWHAGATTAVSILQWLADYHRIAIDDLQPCHYIYQQQDALTHTIKVASGLDSMVLGEPQIFGQMKSAVAVARQAGTVHTGLTRVFDYVFRTAKKVRTDTAIGENPVSVAYAAVDLARHIFTDLRQNKALLIGAGETIELVAKHLQQAGVSNIVVANRTLDRAQALAQHLHADAVLLADIPEQLVTTDIVVASTASQLPLLGKGAVERALKIRKHRPILMIDLAVPRDIEPQVDELNDIYLYSVDDLAAIVDDNKGKRVQAASKAEAIIVTGVAAYQRAVRSQSAVASLKLLRSQAENVRDRALRKALQQLRKGEDAETVLQRLARDLTKKLLHTPSVQIKQAGAEGHDDWLHSIRRLLDLGGGDK